MRTVIFGSRRTGLSLNQQVELVLRAIEKSRYQVTEVVSGAASGIDSAGIVAGRILSIPVVRFQADWSLGRAAGMIRNKQMAQYADQGIGLIWGNSPGSRHMEQVLRTLRKPVFIVNDGEIDYAF